MLHTVALCCILLHCVAYCCIALPTAVLCCPGDCQLGRVDEKELAKFSGILGCVKENQKRRLLQYLDSKVSGKSAGSIHTNRFDLNVFRL